MGIYKRGVVISGVVSLTMGNSFFPFGNGLAYYMETDGKLLLGEAALLAQSFQIFIQHKIPPHFISTASADMLF